MATPLFHLAFPVTDLAETAHFYADVLGCKLGRRTEHWVDLDFYGHQLSAHLAEDAHTGEATNNVDGVDVPVRHFGAILQWDEFNALADRLQNQGIQFIIEPGVRFKERKGEQATMFFLDPSGNALEFKAFRDPAQIFAA